MNLNFSASDYLSSFFSLAAVFLAAWLAFGYEKRKAALDKQLSACRDLYILLADLKAFVALRTNREIVDKLMSIAVDLAIAGDDALLGDVTDFMDGFKRSLDNYEEMLSKAEKEEQDQISLLMDEKGYTQADAEIYYHREILKDAPISTDEELEDAFPFRNLLVSDKSIEDLMNKVKQRLGKSLQFIDASSNASREKIGPIRKVTLIAGLTCVLFMPAILQVIYSIPLFESKISAESALSYYTILACAFSPVLLFLLLRR